MKTYNVGTFSIVRSELIVNSVFMFLATVAVGLRIYARRLRKIALWWDDYTVLACIVSIIVQQRMEMDTIVLTAYSVPCLHYAWVSSNLYVSRSRKCAVFIAKGSGTD